VPIDAATVSGMIDRELEQLSDSRVIAHIRGLRAAPTAVLRDWDYGAPGEQYPCWTVLSESQYAGIAYCERLAPRNAWGLASSGSDERERLSKGMGSNWLPTFLDAYFNSAASEVPIWRVFKTAPSGLREPVTDEDSWEPRGSEYTRKGSSFSQFR
jgi:hypothetical protein